VIETVFTLAFLAQVIRISVPYAFAALGGSVTERSGMIDLALEAKLLFGAFAAAAVGHATGSAVAGIAGGVVAGMAVAAVQSGCAQWLGADQVIIGVALNVIALGGTRFLLQAIYHEGANSPPAPSYGDAVLTNPLVPAALVCAILVPLAVRRSRWGLRLRAAGDRPDALVAVGVSPRRTRLYAALVGGALAGAGGAQLSLVVGGFSADMSSGRGYIALAMVILSGWKPAAAAVACVGVAFAEALSIQVQLHAGGGGSELRRQIVDLAPLLPYVVTLVVITIWAGKDRPPPAALGKL
jgi:general nucleoside transport system permease protein